MVVNIWWIALGVLFLLGLIASLTFQITIVTGMALWFFAIVLIYLLVILVREQ